MKKSPVLAVMLSILLVLTLLPCAVTAEETTTAPVETTVPDLSALVPDITFDGTDASVTHGCHSLDSAYPLHGSDPILTYSQAAVLYEVNSGTLLYCYNPDEPMYPSSMVKVMTALLAVERGNLDEMVTVSTRAVESIPRNALKTGLRPGEEMSLRNLLYCLIVGSGNDAAAVIAEHVAGTQEAFVERMNKRAGELGCTATRFMNVHGLHHEQQKTTARDMAKIMVQAMKYEDFKTISATARCTIPATNSSDSRFLTTLNLMLDPEYRYSYYDSRVTGGRTGVTEDDKRCFVATAESGNLCYVSVVLGATPEYRRDDPSRVKKHGSFEDTKVLLDLGFKTYAAGQILYKGQITGQYSVMGGENDIVVGPNKDVECIYPSDGTMDQLVTRIQMVSNTIQAPVKKGDRIAVMQVWYGSVCVAQADLLARNASRVSQAVAEQERNEQSGFDAGAISTAMTVLIVMVVLIFGLSLGLWIVRKLRSGTSRRRKHRRRRSR